jgi:two-component system response regulator DegU
MSDSNCKIVLVDDHMLFRYGLRLLIENEGLGRVMGEAENGQKFLNLIENEKPDLVIMDIDMPVMNGMEATERALAKYPDINILVLSMHGDQQHYNHLINAGAKGFVLKSAGKQELESAIKSVAQGECFFSSDLLRKIIVDISKPQLKDVSSGNELIFKERELEILKLFCNGFTAIEIAEKVFFSVKTVEAYRSKLLAKTGTKNTVSLVLYAIKNKIVTI